MASFEINRAEKHKYHMVALICGIQKQNKQNKIKTDSERDQRDG